MAFRSLLRSAMSLAFAVVLSAPLFADVSHVRVVRLSLVQGDVRFTRDSHDKDPLNDAKAQWETAPLNLPIRHGYIVATGNGRAEVEFEDGAMAFLSDNTALEFYDLSLEDGAKTTRLILRQGTAEFYVTPAAGDYFSVTGGEFSVEAGSKTRFRLDNFDDGSKVSVLSGRANVLQKKGVTPLSKGQTLSMNAGDELSVTLGKTSESDADDFDGWVSGHIGSVVSATNASLQYGASQYSAGYADLYTYGTWVALPGYGYGWRPFGAGFGWSPFDNGCWFFDPVFGWSFAGYQPWGWLPYHFGGWLFQPGWGWVWVPGGLGGGPILWRPSTAVWVRNKGGVLGVVPIHPLDAKGKAPLNLSQGVFAARGAGVGAPMQSASGEQWKVLKSAPRDALTGRLAGSEAPQHVSRTLLAGSTGMRSLMVGRASSIAFDARSHRFVNTEAPPSASAQIRGGAAGRASSLTAQAQNANTARGTTPPASRTSMPPSGRMASPPPPRNSSGGGRASGGFPSGGSSGGARPSGGGGASHPSSSGGARPH